MPSTSHLSSFPTRKDGHPCSFVCPARLEWEGVWLSHLHRPTQGRAPPAAAGCGGGGGGAEDWGQRNGNRFLTPDERPHPSHVDDDEAPDCHACRGWVDGLLLCSLKIQLSEYVKNAKTGNSKVAYATMLTIRASLIVSAGTFECLPVLLSDSLPGYRLAQAATIGIRYAAVRHQVRWQRDRGFVLRLFQRASKNLTLLTCPGFRRSTPFWITKRSKSVCSSSWPSRTGTCSRASSLPPA